MSRAGGAITSTASRTVITLHSYVLRELLKTLALTLAGLTVLFTMGGGLYNLVRYEGVSAADVLRLVPLLIPMAITITMPIAAVFATAMTYGRLAADNELTACRAAGINVHRLFLAPVLVSVFVALLTFLLGNFLVPSAAMQIELFVRRNVRDLVAQALQGKGFIHRGKSGQDCYTLTAERVQGVSEAALRQKGFETADGLHYLLITNPTLLHLNGHGELVRFAVARYGLCIFDTRPDPMEISLIVREGRDFEVGKQAVVVGQQQIGPVRVPLEAPFRLSIARLTDLLCWRQAPWKIPDLKRQIADFQAELARQRFLQRCLTLLTAGQAVQLEDDVGGVYRITATGAQRGRGGLTLSDGQVELQRPDQRGPVVYQAPRLELNTVPVGSELLVEIRLLQAGQQDVLEYDPRRPGASPRRKASLSLDGPRVPEAIGAEPTAAKIIDRTWDLNLDRELVDRRVVQSFEEQRIGLQKSARRWQRKIDATLHARLGYISSVLVTVLMAGVLGVIFRGARVLAAVALSLIPFFSVGILMMLGSHLTKNESTTMIGPLVTWGGLGLMLWADGLMLWLGVRR